MCRIIVLQNNRECGYSDMALTLSNKSCILLVNSQIQATIRRFVTDFDTEISLPDSYLPLSEKLTRLKRKFKFFTIPTKIIACFVTLFSRHFFIIFIMQVWFDVKQYSGTSKKMFFVFTVMLY